MNDFLNKVGMDKILHFSLGGLIAALMTLVVILQDVEYLSKGALLCTPFIGTVCVFIISVMKEIADGEFNWKDVIAGVLGTVPVYIATALGVLFNVLSK